MADTKQRLVQSLESYVSDDDVGLPRHEFLQNVIDRIEQDIDIKVKRLDVGRIIFDQLGGNKFVTMTGARDILYTDKGISLRVNGKSGDKRVNKVVITLADDDTYMVEAWFLRGASSTLVNSAYHVYVENLRDTFTRLTGLHTSL